MLKFIADKIIQRKIEKLLFELIAFLENHNVNYVQIIKNYYDKIQSMKDSNAMQKLIAEMKIQLFKGMGSLNDVYISKTNGHLVVDEKQANDKLENYRQKLKKTLRSKDSLGSSHDRNTLESGHDSGQDKIKKGSVRK